MVCGTKKEKEPTSYSQFLLPLAASSTRVDARNHYTIMIRKNSLFCKIIRIKKSSVQLFNEYMLSYSWEKETCPWCGSKGNPVSHGSYTRGLTDFVQGKIVDGKVCVPRLLCTSCGQHTHAILPDVIVPYSTYSLFFILRVLAEYFLHLHTVEALCARFGISISMLYRWRGLFLSQKQEWLGVLSSAEIPPNAFLKKICLLPEYSVSFACRFVLLSARSFLQSHKNPADYRQTVF